MSDEQNPPSEPSLLPPPPPTGAQPAVTDADSWAAQAPSPGRRPTGLILGAVAVVLAIVAGLIAFSTFGGDEQSASAQPLSFAFTQGESETYTTHMTMDGQMDAGELLGGSQPLAMDITQTMTWEVTSVDEDGVATVTVTIDRMTGSVNGIDMPADASSMPPMEMQIAPDGRILSAGGLSFAGLDQTGGAGFPGMGQMTPLLPDGPVEPGDTWTEDFSQDIPFGEGSIEYTSTNTLERYEDVDGVNAAVITSEYTVPMDFTIDFGKLLETMGGTEGLTGVTGLADASIAYGGEGSFRMTAWVDPVAKKMLKMTSSGSFDMSIEFQGLEVFEGARMGFTGDFTQDLTLE